MIHETILSVETLQGHQDDPAWVIIDCRFALEDPGLGRRQYREGHIPGAVYCHLNDDLAAAHVPGVTGRHPLPSLDHLAGVFARLGIGDSVQVVAYDDWPVPGGIAARLWWSLRWLGHDAVAVLDGGLRSWKAAGLGLLPGDGQRPARVFTPRPRPGMLATAAEVERLRLDPAGRVFDSRSVERYLGHNETIDPVAGHIPGARPAPYAENAAPDGRMHEPGALKARFGSLLRGASPERSVFYCGSGVTAAYNLLALKHSGLGDGRLYPGSWSEWITDPARPVEREEG